MKTKQKDFKTIPVRQHFKTYKKKVDWDIYLTPDWARARTRANPPTPLASPRVCAQAHRRPDARGRAETSNLLAV